MYEFNQQTYVPGNGAPSSISLNPTGYVYIPNNCMDTSNSCRVHVVFHGCEQTISDIGTLYTTNTGYNSWADANNLIILYPQAAVNYILGNPFGCWNWWGYASNPTTYDDQKGYQIQTVRNMVYALAGKSMTTVAVQ